MLGAIVLLNFGASVMALGSATVVNKCDFPIFYAPVSQNTTPGMQQMQGDYSQQYSQPGNGYSIKLSPSPSGSITQFEFTLDSHGNIFYDLSNINGNPFASNGMRVDPSMIGDSSNPSCVAIDCPAGPSTCSAAYNQPDDVRTHACSDQSDLVLTICPDGGSAGSPASPNLGPATRFSSTISTLPSQSAYTRSFGQHSTKHGHRRVHSRAFRV